MTIVRISTYFIIGTIPILFASVQPWVWSFYALCMVAGYIIFLWHGRVSSNVYASVPGIKLALGSFFTISLFLCLPLPPMVLSFLSPVRFQKVTSAWSLTDSHPAWESISYTSRSAFTWWVFLLSLLLFFIVLQDLFKDRKNLKIVVFIMIGIGLLEAVYGLIQALTPSLGVLWVDYIESYMGTARGTFINRNNFAAFINMIWPLALGLTLEMNGKVSSLKATLSSDRLNRHALMALGVIVFLLALILTRSRAGISSGIVGFMAFMILSRTKKNYVAVQTQALLCGIIVLFCVYTITIGVGPIKERFLAVVAESNFRLLVWVDSLSIIKDHPLGIGLRNYENVFSIYNQSFVTEKTVMYAHNDYLQLLIETGWVGFFTLIGGFVFFIGRSFRLIRRLDFKDDPMRFFFAVGAFSGIISLALHSFSDFNLQIPANCLYFVTLIAILSSCTIHAKRPQGLQSTCNNDLAECNQPDSISTAKKRIYN
jgi:O-antigen ligase